MTRSTYLRYEVLRNFRNWRFLFLTLAFPLVLYFVGRRARTGTPPSTASPSPSTSWPPWRPWARWPRSSRAAAVIAADRSAGWTRQMRITPLRAATYFGAKVLCGYLMALLTIVLLCLAGTALGVRLSAAQWLTVVGLLLVGLIPFAVLGILLGHLLSADSSARPWAGSSRCSRCSAASTGSRSRTRALVRGDQGHSRPTGWCRPGRLRSAAAAGRPRAGSWSPSGPPSSPRWPSSSTGATPAGPEASKEIDLMSRSTWPTVEAAQRH